MSALAAISTPVDHARALHDGGRGYVALAQIMPGGGWRQWSIPVADLAYAVRDLGGRADVYLSQNTFWTYRRRIVDLAQLDALFCDLDHYKTPYRDWIPGIVLEAALRALEAADLPAPSFGIATGRGVALVWLHSGVPRHALPRWQLCQRKIFEVLAPFGADPQAVDAARVMRLVGTRNSKSGTVVEAITPASPPWPFDALADEILPHTRAEIVALRVEAAKRRAERREHHGHVAPARFTAATLWEARLTELQALLKHRWFGCLPPGHRHDWLFIAGVAVSYLAPPPVVRRELYHLARYAAAGAWSDGETMARLHGIIPRAEGYARGERIAWHGRERDPRLHFRTETIIRWLDISEAEMRELGFRSLVTPEIRREQERTRSTERRRAQGMISREDFLAESRERQKPWKSEGVSRRTWYRRRRGTGLYGCRMA
jgi:hypothetical protein